MLVFFNCFFRSLFVINCMTFWYSYVFPQPLFPASRVSCFSSYLYLLLSSYIYQSYFLGRAEEGTTQSCFCDRRSSACCLCQKMESIHALSGLFTQLFLSDPSCLPPPILLITALSAPLEFHLPCSYPNVPSKAFYHTAPFARSLNSFRACTMNTLYLRRVSLIHR